LDTYEGVILFLLYVAFVSIEYYLATGH